jgi:inhibitor of KinA sporulation pathway (predicted exonuclease)
MARELERMLVVDLELTCGKGDFDREIIEIGYAVLDLLSLNILSRGKHYVKPRKSKITPYCTALTGITQEFIDQNGIPLERATKLMVRDGFRAMSWGSWGIGDLEAMQKECELKKAVYPFGIHYTNIQFIYSMLKGREAKTNLKNALCEAGITPEGVWHSGEADAVNTAALLAHTLDKARRSK